ncbi:hypothetical protein AJ80_06709 [Polytolypa hystricis UAMH7299]|uniref:Uncharacterized protein n=1 Tax=Polytolypa hystricis (strain UAMH7299) TaxID=1447883 RepID=A0A2B7XUV4_POLH7|nr:hypothetical protein AJ80_06709 [Polytolypa hystricis UAMH7299]
MARSIHNRPTKVFGQSCANSGISKNVTALNKNSQFYLFLNPIMAILGDPKMYVTAVENSWRRWIFTPSIPLRIPDFATDVEIGMHFDPHQDKGLVGAKIDAKNV